MPPSLDDPNDLRQIGLTPQGKTHLDAIMESGWFDDRQDAYRTAIALALASDIIANEEQVRGAVTAYNFNGGIDRDGKVRTLVALFRPDLASTPARTAERLAHAGLAVLAENLAGDGRMLSEIIGLDGTNEPPHRVGEGLG